MAVACGVSFGLCNVRVTRLDENGVAMGGAGNTYTTDRGVTLGLSPNIETGNTFNLRNGCGCSISRFKSLDVFNWFEWGNPNTNVSAATYGQITSALSPRVLQLAVKFNF